MSIVYPLAMPATPLPRRLRFAARGATLVNESIFTFQQEVFEHVGNRWEVEVELPAMGRAEHDAWKAWALSLYGQAGTFLLGDATATSPRGTPAGTPLVDGANAANAKTLATRGWTPSAAGVLLKGDWIQLGSGATARLHMVLADASADGSGEAVLDLWPRLRTAYADGAAIVTSSAKGVFRLAQPAIGWDIERIATYGLTFAAVEAL